MVGRQQRGLKVGAQSQHLASAQRALREKMLAWASVPSNVMATRMASVCATFMATSPATLGDIEFIECGLEVVELASGPSRVPERNMGGATAAPVSSIESIDRGQNALEAFVKQNLRSQSHFAQGDDATVGDGSVAVRKVRRKVDAAFPDGRPPTTWEASVVFFGCSECTEDEHGRPAMIVCWLPVVGMKTEGWSSLDPIPTAQVREPDWTRIQLLNHIVSSQSCSPSVGNLSPGQANRLVDPPGTR